MLVLGAYVLLTVHRLVPSGRIFQEMNVLGGLFLIFSTAYFHAWSSVALNVAWVAIGTIGLLQKARTRSQREAPSRAETLKRPRFSAAPMRVAALG